MIVLILERRVVKSSRASPEKWSPECITLMKAKHPWHVWRRFSHRNDANNNEDSFKSGTPCYDLSDAFETVVSRHSQSNARSHPGTKNYSAKKTIIGSTAFIEEAVLSPLNVLLAEHSTFVCVQPPSIKETPVNIDPLVDDGAQYHAIGDVLLHYLCRTLFNDILPLHQRPTKRLELEF